MPQTLEFHLLGGLRIGLNGEAPFRFASRRAGVMLAYIAMNQQPYSRESLAVLLWDDRDPKQAMANLRSLLAQLPKALKPYLTITRQTVSFSDKMPVWVDALMFLETEDWRQEANFAQFPVSNPPIPQLEEAAALYVGGFLEGVFVRESWRLEEWTAVTRERLQQHAIQTHSQLAYTYFYRREYAPAIQHTQALLALDPLREGSHRLLIRLLARDGQLNAAIQQYEQCRAILDDELGVTPSPQTRALHERLLSAKLPTPFVVPALMTPFVGRAAELAQIEAQLDEGDCRLLTLVGTGGVGKTRLAIQTAAARRRDYLHGIFYIPLAGVETAVAIPTHIAAALNYAFQSKQSPQTEMLVYLQNKEMLLVLDNFEHLLPDGVHFVTDLLAQAHDVQLLVTSQALLHIVEEKVLSIPGLSYEDEQGEAVAMFQAYAGRAQPGFVLDEETGTAVKRICHLLEGLPLGIELAASWSSLLGCDEIATEIERNLDFLTSQQYGVPERHRSLQAVFNYAWNLLTPPEKETLLKLSCFHGGFHLQAAHAIVATALPMLQTLVSKSLLHRDGAERYTMLEVWRVYVREKLRRLPDIERVTRQQHCHYYSEFLQKQASLLVGAAPLIPLNAVQTELENIRASWHWAIQSRDAAAVERSLETLTAFYLSRGPFIEIQKMLEVAIAAWQEEKSEAITAVLAQLYMEQARFLNKRSRFERGITAVQNGLALIKDSESKAIATVGRLQWGQALLGQGQHQEAKTQYETVLAEGNQSAAYRTICESYNGLGIVYTHLGDYAAAKHSFEQALRHYQDAGDLHGEGGTLNNLGVITKNMGDLATAETYYQQALNIYQQTSDQVSQSKTLNNLGVVARSRGDYAQAQIHYEQALALKREIGDRYGEGLILNNLGNIAARQKDFDVAQTCFEQALQLNRTLRQRRNEAMVLSNLALLLHRRGQDEQSESHSEQALKIAEALGDRPTQGFALTHLGHALAAQGKWGAAQASFQQAVDLRRQLGEANLMMESLAGMAHVALVQDEMAQALSYVEEIVAHMQAQSLMGVEEPAFVYKTCYEVLQRVGDGRSRQLYEEWSRLAG